LVRKTENGDVVFEAFESSALPEDVIGSPGALKWSFPGSAVLVESSTFNNEHFLTELSNHLEKMSAEHIKEFMESSKKAGAHVTETRSSTNPKLVTDMLMSLLQAIGRPLAPTQTVKRVRDEVNWDDSKNPWRRSPTWLVLRVGIQRYLVHLFGPTSGLLMYKNFVAFHLAGICSEVVQSRSFKPEVVAFMRSKLARRLFKLQKSAHGDAVFGHLWQHFTQVLEMANTLMEDQWARIQKDCSKIVGQLPLPNDFSPGSLRLSLSNSRDYIHRVQDNSLRKDSPHDPDFHCHSRRSTQLNHLPILEFGDLSGFELHLVLADLEEWVKNRLPTWKRITQASDACCKSLAELMVAYEATATLAYRHDSDQISQMLLTIMELWIALDQMTGELYPLLQEYSPEIPPTIMYSCRFAGHGDMQRLHALEMYIKQRHRSINSSSPSILFHDPSHGSFADNYYAQSLEMQKTRKEIQKQGDINQERKQLEWSTKSNKYKSLQDQAQNLLHSTRPAKQDNGETVEQCWDCHKCSLTMEAAGIIIRIDEYPLPRNEIQARAAVFELCCPSGFASWRDVTWRIVTAIGGNEDHQVQPKEPTQVVLQKYTQLTPYVKSDIGRLTLASTTKSFLVSHYHDIAFPVDVSKVCLANALKYRLYDSLNDIWTSDQSNEANFAPHNIAYLPVSSEYRSLQATVDFTCHTSNEIIASQSRCPLSMSIQEFLAFQDIRSGQRLQLPKILRELASTNLDFGAEGVAILITHAALQAGDGLENNPLRVSHQFFRDSAFCVELVRQLRKKLESICANWKEIYTMKIIIVLLLRLGSLASAHVKTTRDAKNLLVEARNTTLQWIRSIRQEVNSAKDAEVAQKLSRSLLLNALLCRRTFDLDVEQLEVSCLSSNDVSIFVECAIVIHDNTPANLETASLQLRQDLAHDWRLAHDMEFKLSHSIANSEMALVRAIKQNWPSSGNFGPWTFLPTPNERWVTAKTESTMDSSGQKVQFNVLEGRLLVDGRPVGRLPADMTKQTLYQRMFIGRVFEVYPSQMPEMTYASASYLHDHEVHFGLRNGSLIIRAVKRGAPHTLELIPHTIFKKDGSSADLPLSLVDDCAHWLDLASGTLEIRPLKQAWLTSLNNWHLNIEHARASRRDDHLVESSSKIFGIIASTIEPFEDRSRMVVYQSANQRLNLFLPRYKMTFTVNDNGLLESSELRAVVRSNQDIGTLYGLETKLVLEDVANQRERSVLVPRGAVRVEKRSTHVQVNIDTPGEVAVSCCRFSLNAFLRRLDCRAELRDVYYKAYLHAITSFVLPDPFTGRTGTEMALDCLKSGLAQLTVPLDSESIKTLVALSCLTPRRINYPSHLQVMQTVEWSPALSAAAQHDDFNIAVNTIFARSALYRPFHTDLKSRPEPLLSRGDSHLLLRARSRHSAHRNAECTFSLLESVQDNRYNPRDSNRGSQGSLRVFEVASLVRQWSSNIDVAQNLCDRFRLWKTISGYGKAFQETSLDQILHLDFAEQWGSLFEMCQRSAQLQDTFKLMFLFSTISFGNNVDMAMLRTLMAVAFVPNIKAMKVPQWSSYVGFRDGEVPTEVGLQFLMQATFAISRNTRKRPIAERLAAQVAFRAKCTATEDFARFLIRQWPCLEPCRTGYGDSNVISIDAVLNTVRAEWSRLFVNSRFAEHVRELQEYLKACQARTSFRPVLNAVPIEVVHPGLGSVVAAPSLRNLLGRMIRGPLLRKCAQVLNGTESARSEQTYDENRCELSELLRIVIPIKSDQNQIRSRYGNDLWQSLNALQIVANSKEHRPRVTNIDSTPHAIKAHEKSVQEHFEVLVVSLQRSNDFKWLSLGDQWPRTTPTTLLESLRKCVPDLLSGVALEAVVEYGESITQLQRAVRIEKALRMNNLVQLNEELLNEGHEDWEPK